MVEARADAAAGCGHACRVDQKGGFDAERRGQIFEGGFDVVRGPRFDAGQAVAEDVETLEGAIGAEGFLDAGFVVGEVLVEGEFDPRGDIGEMFDLLFDQGQRRQEGFAGAVVDAGLFDEGDAEVGEALEGHLDEVLAVHPETFVEVEAGAAAVDVL